MEIHEGIINELDDLVNRLSYNLEMDPYDVITQMLAYLEEELPKHKEIEYESL